MRIAQLAPPLETVPPARYGGTERVISTLTEELVRRGHDVSLFGAGGSKTSGRLVVTCEEAVWHRDPPFRDLMPSWSVVAGKLLRELHSFDVVHSHVDWYGFPIARMAGVPMVTTLHGRLDVPDVVETFREFCDVPLVSISNAQRAPVSWANFVATVYHGIELSEFDFSPERGKYLAFLGRVSPDKGLDTAIRVARKTGMPLRIAARMPLPEAYDPNGRADAEYWEEVIRPMLGDDVELLGEVGGYKKVEFLRDAAALLFPIRWPEPFGLVMVEALACGTPVLALRNGSVPEVIRHGVTGFVGDSEDDLVRAIERLDDLDRNACRADAEKRFSPPAMAEAYECVFERLVAERRNRKIIDLNHLPRLAADEPVDAEDVIEVQGQPI
jgi:glycosyltransferase involved in cell wall biosynthesis